MGELVSQRSILSKKCGYVLVHLQPQHTENIKEDPVPVLVEFAAVDDLRVEAEDIEEVCEVLERLQRNLFKERGPEIEDTPCIFVDADFGVEGAHGNLEAFAELFFVLGMNDFNQTAAGFSAVSFQKSAQRFIGRDMDRAVIKLHGNAVVPFIPIVPEHDNHSFHFTIPLCV